MHTSQEITEISAGPSHKGRGPAFVKGIEMSGMTPLEFLNDLWPDKPEEQFILIWTLQDKRSRWFQKVPDAAGFVATITDKDVYVGVGLAGRDYGPKHRCLSDQITGIAGMSADFDLASPAHPDKALPKTIEQALQIIPPNLPPTIILVTGNGVHCWWLFRELYIFENDEDRKEVTRQCVRFHKMLGIRAGEHKWAYDRLSDLARILRIPGTTNFKDPANPKAITAFSRGGRRYNLSDIVEFLEEIGIPDQEAQERVAKEWAERFADKPLVINLDARIPQDKLEGWMDADLRFKNTWLRQRHDLKDRSNSGYDMALACFGVDAGLGEQEIVDLIVHHRAFHGSSQRRRVDYFQRTIAKAANKCGGADPLNAAPVPEQPRREQIVKDIDNPQEPQQPDPEVARGLLLDRISEALAIRILRLIKVTGADPTYLLHLADGTVVECPSFSKFTDQAWIRDAIGKITNKLIPKFKAKHWEQLAQSMLDALVEQAGGDEVDLKASTRLHLKRYLSEAEFISSPVDLPVQAQRKPTIINGNVAITAGEFLTYVNKATTTQNVTVKMITSRLTALGAESHRPRSGPFRGQSRWLLPPDEFPPTEYCNRAEEAGLDDCE